MLSVVLGAPDVLGQSAGLLDKGFATPVPAESPAGQLPAVHVVMHQRLAATGAGLPAGGAPVVHRATALTATHHSGSTGLLTWIADFTIGLAALVAALRVRAKRRIRARRQRRGTSAGYLRPEPYVSRAREADFASRR
jgi:hypothetical protein